MEKRFFQWIGFGFIVVALLAICNGLISGISNSFTPEKKGDLATWMGAVFTGAAFAGTIWIAGSQRRKSDEDAKALAFVTLISMQFRIHNLRRELEKIAIAMHNWHPQKDFIINYASAGQAIKDHMRIQISETERLIPLDRNIAVGIASAIDLADYYVPFLLGAASNSKINTPEDHTRFCSEVGVSFAAAAMHLRSAALLAASMAGSPDAKYEDNGIPEIAGSLFRSWTL